MITFAVRQVSVVNFHRNSAKSYLIQVSSSVFRFLGDMIPYVYSFSIAIGSIIISIWCFLRYLKSVMIKQNTIETCYIFWISIHKISLKRRALTFPPSTITILSSNASTYGENESFHSLWTRWWKVRVSSLSIVNYNTKMYEDNDTNFFY